MCGWLINSNGKERKMKYVTGVRKIVPVLLIAVMSSAVMSGCTLYQNQAPLKTAEESTPQCSIESLPDLPDVRITEVTEESEPVPHCKVAGVIGPEIRFELLLPD
jgi:hypothetical protein